MHQNHHNQRTISYSKEELEEAIMLEIKKHQINDTLHAIMAKNTNAILITRDRHFNKLHICPVMKPEDLIDTL